MEYKKSKPVDEVWESRKDLLQSLPSLSLLQQKNERTRKEFRQLLIKYPRLEAIFSYDNPTPMCE